MEDPVLLRIDGAVATITLNRPQVLNALDATMVDGLIGVIEQIERASTPRVVVLGGAGAGFMAGGDIRGFKEVMHLPPAEKRAWRPEQIEQQFPHALRIEQAPAPGQPPARLSFSLTNPTSGVLWARFQARPFWMHRGLPGPAPTWESAAATTFLRSFEDRSRRAKERSTNRGVILDYFSMVMLPALPTSQVGTPSALMFRSFFRTHPHQEISTTEN